MKKEQLQKMSKVVDSIYKELSSEVLTKSQIDEINSKLNILLSEVTPKKKFFKRLS